MKKKLIKLTEQEQKNHKLYGINFGVYLVLILGWFGVTKALADMRVSLMGTESTILEAYFTKGSPLFIVGLTFLVYLVVTIGTTLFALSKSAAFVNFSVIGIFLMWAADYFLIAKMSSGFSGAITHPIVIFKGLTSIGLIIYILSSQRISVTYLGLVAEKVDKRAA